MTRNLQFFFVLVVSIVVCSCATNASRADDFAAKSAIATKAFADQPYSLAYIQSRGALSDALKAAAPEASPGANRDVDNLVSLMLRSESQVFRVAVAGGRDENASAILGAALARLKGKQLPLLQVAFIGGPSYREKLEPSVSALGAKFIFGEYR